MICDHVCLRVLAPADPSKRGPPLLSSSQHRRSSGGDYEGGPDLGGNGGSKSEAHPAGRLLPPVPEGQYEGPDTPSTVAVRGMFPRSGIPTSPMLPLLASPQRSARQWPPGQGPTDVGYEGSEVLQLQVESGHTQGETGYESSAGAGGAASNPQGLAVGYQQQHQHVRQGHDSNQSWSNGSRQLGPGGPSNGSSASTHAASIHRHSLDESKPQSDCSRLRVSSQSEQQHQQRLRHLALHVEIPGGGAGNPSSLMSPSKPQQQLEGDLMVG
jgi:hypothetical protein